MNAKHRFWCFALAMAIMASAAQAQSHRSRSGSSPAPSRSASSRSSTHSSGFSRAVDGIGRIFSPSRSTSRSPQTRAAQAPRSRTLDLPNVAREPRRVFESPRYSAPLRRFESPERRPLRVTEPSQSNRRRFQEATAPATRFSKPPSAPSVSSASPRRRYLASHYSNLEGSFAKRATTLAQGKTFGSASTFAGHASAFNAGAVVTSSASWCKKPSFQWSIGVGWPYWFFGKGYWGGWYGPHFAYYFSLAWWEPYACYPWYASWNPYPCHGWSYWCAPWIYAPVVAPVYYCDYYTAPSVVHTTTVVHDVVHVEGDNYVKKYSAAPAKDEAEELKKLTPSEQFQRLGDIHFREGRYDQAASAYERAIQENPDHAALRFVLADARFAMGDFHGAASAIRQGLSKDPGLAKAKANKLAFYENPQAFEKQLQALRAYAGAHPADVDAQLVLGFNLLFSGKEDEARVVFEKAKAIDAEDGAATLFLEALKK